MLKGKQRAYLRSIANTLKPSTQIGKDGVTESFLEQLDDMLRKREIVKVTILETAGLETKETATLYKKNTENPQIVFPGHEQAKSKVKAENVTKKGRVTKRSVR